MSKHNYNGDTGAMIVAVLLIVIVCFVVSYFAFAGIFYLICKCFEWTFTWKLSSGLWLVSLLISGIFKSKVTVNKNND